MDDGSGTRVARDNGLANTVFDILPSRAMDPSSADIRASPLPSTAKTSKRKGTSGSDDNSPAIISLRRYNARGYWITTKSSKRGRIQTPKESHMEMHQSTCLNLNGAAASTESDLWILPDFDEWELDTDTTSQQPATPRAPILERAVNSNRERLRRRLEGDGWDFVGGKYGEDEKIIQEAATIQSQSEESVDEEFDVVVLPVVQVSC